MRVTQRVAKAILATSLLLANFASIAVLQTPAARAAALPAYRYTKIFDTSAGTATGNGVTTDKNGNVIVTGFWSGTVGFGPGDMRTSANTDAFITKYSANGSYLWTRTFDVDATASNGYAFNAGTDGSGNVFVTGQWQGTVVFDGVGGSDSHTDINSFNTYITKVNANGSYGWTKIFDGTSGSSNGAGIAVDTAGNIYIDGFWQNTIKFDGIGGSDSRSQTNGSVFLTKYNANGSYGWTKTFAVASGGFGDNASALVLDSAGNIYIGGLWQSNTTFDGVGGSDTRTTSQQSVYVTKYSPTGAYAWTRTFSVTASSATAYLAGMTTDKDNNVIIAGNWQKAVTFDGVGGSDSRLTNNSFGDPDSFVTKYTSSGAYAWTRTADITGSGAFASASGVSADIYGNVYVAGYWGGDLVFDGVGGSDARTSANTDGYLSVFSPTGAYNYSKVFDVSASSAQASVVGIYVDNTTGNLYMTGQFQDTVIFDGVGGGDSKVDPGGGVDAFLTSWQVFIPPTPPAASPIGAPDTGFGKPASLWVTGVAPVALIVLGSSLVAVAWRQRR